MSIDLLKEALAYVEECAEHSVSANDLAKKIRKSLRESAKAEKPVSVKVASSAFADEYGRWDKHKNHHTHDLQRSMQKAFQAVGVEYAD